MVDDHALRTALAQYVRTTVGTYGIGETLYQLTDRCMEVIDCDGGGVSIGDRDGQLRFVTATDAFVFPAEEQQALVQEGPCHEAYTKAEVVVVPDLEDERDRWPGYAPVALGSGCRSVMGVPIDVEDASIGALNLYHRHAHDWSAEEIDAARLLAGMAAGYVSNLRTLEDSRQLATQLQHALDSRIVIEQAKGIIAARNDVDVAAAFSILRRVARDRECRIHDVAQRIVEGELEV